MDSFAKKKSKMATFKNVIFFYNNCANPHTLIGRELWPMREKTMKNDVTCHALRVVLFWFFVKKLMFL